MKKTKPPVQPDRIWTALDAMRRPQESRDQIMMQLARVTVMLAATERWRNLRLVLDRRSMINAARRSCLRDLGAM